MKLLIEELHAAAFFFSKHPESTAEQVGAFVGKSPRTILRWSETAEWETALDNLGFTGDRGWRRNVQRDVKRDDGDIVDLAKTVYLRHRELGHRKGASVQITAQQVNKAEKTIRNWRKRFNWEAAPTPIDTDTDNG